ncbi:Tigger transposable element-derived protein 4 [Araneus ventricosus]|uniref:Tigger transposable element-derived protein 4 n=1 Tax=Araneus ventricosus TaxID=182803 RepID=A0A4Y2F4V7_ARAVE|nr:Tigger transposable element-derived protein 4 [Araneus ventricosus]
MYLYPWMEHTHQVSSKFANLVCQNAFRLDDFTWNIPVIESHEKGNSESKLADILCFGKTQINKILKDNITIRKEWENFKFPGVKRMRMEKFPEINEALIEWFKSVRAKNIPISGTLMNLKAMDIADALGTKDFCASNGWLDKFRVRNNVVFCALCGEAADVDEKLCEDWTTRLPLLLAGYADKDIFNMDETFFSCPPK